MVILNNHGSRLLAHECFHKREEKEKEKLKGEKKPFEIVVIVDDDNNSLMIFNIFEYFEHQYTSVMAILLLRKIIIMKFK